MVERANNQLPEISNKWSGLRGNCDGYEYFWSSENQDRRSLFLGHMDCDLEPKDFEGPVLHGGVGLGFAERIWSFSLESKYRKVREGVEKVVCCDAQEAFSPWIIDKDSLVTTYGDKFDPKNLEAKVTLVYDSFWNILDKSKDEAYQSITFCRIVSLPEQLSSDRLEAVYSRLKTGGVAVLSGSYEGVVEKIVDGVVVRKVQNLQQIVDQSRSDVSEHSKLMEVKGGGFFEQGMGGSYAIVMRKPLK